MFLAGWVAACVATFGAAEARGPYGLVGQVVVIAVVFLVAKHFAEEYLR